MLSSGYSVKLIAFADVRVWHWR